MTAVEQPHSWKRAARSLLTLEPVRHARWEIIVLRVILAMLFWDIHTGWIAYKDRPLDALTHMVTQHNDVKYETQEHPNGVATFVNLTFLSRDNIETPLRLATAASLLLYAVGVPAAFSLVLPLLFGCGVMTLANSQGAINHISQVLHVAMLAIWLASLWSFGCKSRGRPLPHAFCRGELELDWARQSIMAGYVVSAISKVILSGGEWLTTARYLPLHIMKGNDMEFYETLYPAAQRLDWLPQVMMDHPALCTLFFGLGLPLELFAFLGLRNRRAALLFGIALIAFHESVTQLMSLSFIFNKWLLFFLFVNPLGWITKWCKHPACSQKS